MKEMCSLCCQTGEGIGDTDFGYTLSLISGKYKLVIMYWLANHKEVMRYSEIKRCMGNISHKTLSATLKEMEADRLIVRKEYPQIPPKVEYSLSERGKSLVPVLVAMCKWGGCRYNSCTCISIIPSLPQESSFKFPFSSFAR